MIEFYD